jgi:hypothetical protein
MKPFLKYGLIVGAISFVAVLLVSSFMGICGPGVTLFAGAIAGFLTAYNGHALSRQEGAQSGAIAGAIAGGLALKGQVIGGIIALALVQYTGTPTFLGNIPSLSSPLSQQILYYGGGLITGFCFGIFGIGLGAAIGGLTGAFGVRQLPTPVNTTSDGEGN